MNKSLHIIYAFLVGCLMSLALSCTHDINGLELATYPQVAEVFIDNFTGDLQYAAFGGSDVEAFDIDYGTKYKGTCSMRMAVPNENDPNGSYAGGVFYSTSGRDLSDYNCLTFWGKASQWASIGVLGVGNDLGLNKYQASISDVVMNTNWKKYYIPIPDASKLIAEKGMFFFSEGPEDGKGYTFWIDEVQFEKIDSLYNPRPAIFNGENKVVSTFNGLGVLVYGFSETFNLPTTVAQKVNVGPAYFSFNSSDPAVASVDADGNVSVLQAGTSVITASVAGVQASGSLTINSLGKFVHAPTPTAEADKVISLFSDAYANVPVDWFNGYWEPYQTTESEIFEIENDHILSYVNFNFVGNQFSNPTVDAAKMTHLHMDIYVPVEIGSGAQLSLTLRDFGADNVEGGGNDTDISQLFTGLVAGQWNSLEMPIKKMANRSHLGLIIYENGGPLTSLYVDNIYFFDDGSVIPVVPKKAAPTPTREASNVLSIFSDAYTNVPDTDFNPNWGQSTIVSQPEIEGNKTLLYNNLNYQGTQFAGNIDASKKTHLHIDYYTSNATSLNFYLISQGPVEKAYALEVPSSIDWNSLDIPLSAFEGINLAEIFQLKVDGNGDVYFDNIYFYSEGSAVPVVPTKAAPTPTREASTVLSIFSEAYTNVADTDFFPNWGQSTQVSQPDIAGNKALFYANLNYQGTQFATPLDVASKGFLHLDYYTGNATFLNFFLISEGPVEKAFALEVPSSADWSSVDIPLSAFEGVALNNIIQFKVEGTGDVFFDNIYFY